MITLEMWREFADAVEAHIRDYTIPQYGDWPDDQMSTFTDEDIKTAIARYENRRGKGARGIEEEMRDCLKIAHYYQCLWKREAPRVEEWRRCADILTEVIEDERDLTGSIGQACEHWHKLRKEHNPMQRVRIKKVRDNAVLPEYGSEGAAGMDFRACDSVTIPAHGVAKIPLGWAAEVPEGFQLEIRSRSGVSSKTDFLLVHGTVDSDYRGEISAVVRNESNSDATISEGYKIAQGVLMPVYRATLVETDDLSETVRGASGFGSTGV
jgi:dUTP pyrophosphatase